VLLASCGGPEAELLRTANAEKLIYAGSEGGGGGNYRPTSTDPSTFGTLHGRVVFEGDGWRIRRIALSDQFCIDQNHNELMSEDFLLGPDGGLANVVVFIQSGLQTMKFDPPSEPVVLDQHNCQYHPHVAVIQTGQPLVIKSSDNTLHNVHAADGPNEGFNQSMSKPSTLAPRMFYKTEIAKQIACDVHSWMRSYLAILPHPCWAITGPDGSFTIKGVPPGHYLLAAWHERFGDVAASVEITVEPNEDKTIENLVIKRS